MEIYLILIQLGESVNVYCIPCHMIVSALCFPLDISLVLSLQLRWTAKVIAVNHPQ